MYIKYLKNYFEKQKFHPSFEEWNSFYLYVFCGKTYLISAKYL